MQGLSSEGTWCIGQIQGILDGSNNVIAGNNQVQSSSFKLPDVINRQDEWWNDMIKELLDDTIVNESHPKVSYPAALTSASIPVNQPPCHQSVLILRRDLLLQAYQLLQLLQQSHRCDGLQSYTNVLLRQSTNLMVVKVCDM